MLLVLPNKFNKYFIKVAENVIRKLNTVNADPMTCFENPQSKENLPKCFFKTTTQNPVRDVINSLSNKSSIDVKMCMIFLLLLLNRLKKLLLVL